jgi:hypothetical protein
MWLDKEVLLFISVLTAVFLLLMSSVIFGKAGSCISKLILGAIDLLVFFSAGHMWPIRVVSDKIYLAREKFPSFGQRAVSLQDVSKMSISGKRRWDEMGRFFSMTYLRVTDKKGKRYRNILASTDGLRETFQRLYADGIVGQSFKDNLPGGLSF